MKMPSVHKTQKRFHLDGIIDDDASFARLRSEFEHLLLTNMREEGYIPNLDGPIWSTSYHEEKDYYTFKLSIYGIYVGRVSATKWEGYTGDGKMYGRL